MITIQDIAKKAGVPVKTASRALAGLTQGKRRDARERAERVLKVAKEMGYQPSYVAQSLRTGKTQTVGMVVGGLSNQYFGCLVEAYLDELEKAGYRLLLQVTKWSEDKEYECLKDLLRHRVDGVIYICDLPRKLRAEHRMLLKHHYPLLTTTANDHGFGMIKHDFSAAIRSAVQFLHDRKDDDVGLVLPDGHYVQNAEIEEAFKSECSKFGIDASVYIIDWGSDIKIDMEKKHKAWLVYGRNVLKRVTQKISANSKDYRPDMIAFCDDIGWELYPKPDICGVIIYQTRKVVEAAVREVIFRIENNTDTESGDVAISAQFAEAKDFGKFKFQKIKNEEIM